MLQESNFVLNAVMFFLKNLKTPELSGGPFKKKEEQIRPELVVQILLQYMIED
jgi:hypothetical protein